MREKTEFECLVAEAKGCLACDRMAGSQRVIGHASGRIDAPIMFIGEAPGRLGADTSAIPFHGDRAGDNFESLIEQVGLSRYDCFITNAILCNPKDEKGNNATPNRLEIVNCARFLKRQIDIVNPKVVVTLGAQALAALRLIEPHDQELAKSVRTKCHWYGRILLPLYHPGQRAMLHRSFLNQLADYRFVADTHRRSIAKRKATTIQPTSIQAANIARHLLLECGPISYFALHKLFYLSEYEHYRVLQRRMTNCYIIRQKDGPYVVDLNIKKLKKALPEVTVWEEGTKLMLQLSDTPSLFAISEPAPEPDDLTEILDRVCARYSKSTDEQLKRISYLTGPMRKILRREKYQHENLFNAPIDFSSIQTSGV